METSNSYSYSVAFADCSEISVKTCFKRQIADWFIIHWNSWIQTNAVQELVLNIHCINLWKFLGCELLLQVAYIKIFSDLLGG